MLSALGVLFDGLAYGSLLFLISIGLSVTMGLMNFINLAHGAFAMAGGYVRGADEPTRRAIPGDAAHLLLITAAIGFVLERTLYRRLYRASPLDQVLFSIALVFMAMAGATYVWGPTQQPMELPEVLRGQLSVFDSGLEIGRYRLFLIGVRIVLTALLVR